MKRRVWIVGVTSVAFFAACLNALLVPTADDWDPPSAPAQASSIGVREACAHSSPLREAFFGDLHVHTRYSMDARSRDMLGTPDDAYRFARGEAIGLGPFDADGRGTRTTQLDRPLDFAAVTDHAEWIGEVTLCTTPGTEVFESEPCQIFRGEAEASGFNPVAFLAGRMWGVIGVGGRKTAVCGEGDQRCRASLLNAWQTTQAATERWNDTTPACSFTSFHGWEHSNSAQLSKIHRNVIFRNAAVPELPISSLEAPDAIDLWDRLDAVCANTDSGCEVVTIPHNPNVSNGRLFHVGWKDESIEEQVRRARARARMERVVEMMQVKGESECKNGMYGVVGGADELCDFEKLRGVGEDVRPDDCEEGTDTGAIRGDGCQSRLDFVRYALVEGLREQERIGVNPMQFGFIGSTDTHNASPGDVEEYSYDGATANVDTTPERRLDPKPSFAGRMYAARNPGGLMGAWAEENTRASIFDAITRRETFATSGPRIRPRFFAAWELPEGLCESRELVSRGYASGVPMGGVLPPAPADTNAPTFVASVLRDAGVPAHPGGLLDRLQIIKVWHGEDGQFHQAVHDIDGRLAGAAPREAPSVDLATCQPRGAGADSLCAVWTDPDFDSARAAAYYVRAVENPSCRWSWRQCLAFPEAERPASCSDPEIPKSIQERVWTSPIWYEPDA